MPFGFGFNKARDINRMLENAGFYGCNMSVIFNLILTNYYLNKGHCAVCLARVFKAAIAVFNLIKSYGQLSTIR